MARAENSSSSGESSDIYSEFSAPDADLGDEAPGEAVAAPTPGASAEPAAESDSSEEAAPEDQASSSSAEGEASSSSAETAPTPVPTPRPEDLLPLDAWVEATPAPTPTPTAAPTPFPEVEKAPVKEEEEEPDDPQSSVQAPPEKVNLTSLQKKRLEAVRKPFLGRVREGRKRFLSFLHRDPRGEPEVRICSINFNNYGDPEQIKKLISQKEAHKMRAKRRSIIAGIDEAECDIVAVQGLVAGDFIAAQDVLAALARELSEASSSNWRSYVGLSNHKNAYNGFLIGSPDFEMLRIRSFNDRQLPLEKGFRAKNFGRDPFQINLRIPGRGTAPPRTLTIVSFQFQESLRPRGPESEKKRLQMSEGLREISSMIQSEASADDLPILVLAGDFAAPRTMASARVLDGTLRLADFGEGGACKINAKEEVVCDPKPNHPKLLFGYLTDSLDVGADRADKKAKLRAIISALQRREEIYAGPPDLHLAWKDHAVPSHYNSGFVRVRNGLKDGPLVWVELNW